MDILQVINANTEAGTYQVSSIKFSYIWNCHHNINVP